MSNSPEVLKVGVGRVMGFLEILDDFGRRVDVAKVAGDLLLDLDDILPVIDTSEILGFAVVEEGDVILSKKGLQFVSQGIRGRKKIIQERLKGLNLFKIIEQKIKQNEENALDKDEILSYLGTFVPEQEVEGIFRVIVEWGRHGLMLRYDSEDGKVRSLQ